MAGNYAMVMSEPDLTDVYLRWQLDQVEPLRREVERLNAELRRVRCRASAVLLLSGHPYGVEFSDAINRLREVLANGT